MSRQRLEAGQHGAVREPAEEERENETDTNRVLRLTLRAPDIAEAILDGRQPERMTLPGLMDRAEVEWAEQRARVS